MKKIFYTLLFISICSSSFAQDFNMQFRSNVTYPGYTCSSCWGYVDNHGNEYALVGTSFGVSIVDITNPDTPDVKFNITHIPSFWREIKTYKNYAYATNEDGGGVLIMDLSYLPDSVPQYTFTYTDANGYQQSDGHELWIDEKGRLFIYGGAYWNAGATIFDLTADPLNPTYLGAYENHYIHAGYVRGDTLWSSEIFDGQVEVINVADPANPELLASWHTPGNFTHNSWPTSDNHYLFTCDEVPGSYVTSYDVADLGNVTELDKIQSTPGTSVIAHNVHLLNDTFAVTAYYCDGVVVFDVSHPDNMVKVASYDTYPFGCVEYNGTWGVWPWFPSGNIITSNIENGLWVVTPTYVQACRVEGVTTDFINGSLLYNVDVTILNTDVDDLTNLSGEYKIGIADSGTYDIQFSLAGYNTKTIHNVVLQNGVVTTLDVQLSQIGTEVSDPSNAFSLQSFPNPFSDVSSLNYDVNNLNGKEISIQVVNSLGQVVTGFPSISSAGTLQWGHNLSKGFYMLQLIVDGKVMQTVKAVKE